ncbi:metal ABC transporter solute-binding protein, Zn/Mn family [Phycisphaerales bacterium AB-hyl4]|uniref:Metal ABC transporter solute-binding protein, Zn/Mn family n=1 Tax=Natronomicrosphaera hydrolytica TaxID=3242702 RepID=A0ABV4U2G4_9BACT
MLKFPRRWIVSLHVLLMMMMTVSLVGCGDGRAGDADDGRLNIVATTGMIADMVRNVVGEHAQVTGLMDEGVDPHLYRPTRSDVLRLDRANVVVYNGLLLEGQMGETLGRLQSADKHVIAVAERLDPALLMEDDEDPDEADPHVWMDVRLWSTVVEQFTEQMAEISPEHAETYRENAERYLAELAELDSYVREVIASIPEEHRVLVTAHDAFNYFGRSYDIEVRGVYGISTESEAGMHDINRLVDFVVERELPAVFAESSVTDRPVQAVIRGAHSRRHNLRLGGELFSDAMGRAGTYEGTYIGMIDHNATTIARALGGDAPERGMQGRLGERP